MKYGTKGRSSNISLITKALYTPCPSRNTVRTLWSLPVGLSFTTTNKEWKPRQLLWVTSSGTMLFSICSSILFPPYVLNHRSSDSVFIYNIVFWLFQCPPDDCDDSKICSSDDLDCFVLDNNGYIVLSENSHNTGRFFGEIHGTIMDLLVEERIYNRIPIYDYQALCFPFLNSDSSGSILNTVSVIKVFKFELYFKSYQRLWTCTLFACPVVRKVLTVLKTVKSTDFYKNFKKIFEEWKNHRRIVQLFAAS